MTSLRLLVNATLLPDFGTLLYGCLCNVIMLCRRMTMEAYRDPPNVEL